MVLSWFQSCQYDNLWRIFQESPDLAADPCLKSLEHNEITRPNGSGFKEKNINKYKQTAVIKESMYICFGFEFIIKDNTRASFGLAYDRGLNGMFRKKYQNTITKESVKAHYNSFEFQFGFIF